MLLLQISPLYMAPPPKKALESVQIAIEQASF